MIIPTTTYREEAVEDEAEHFQILSHLHLCGASQYAAADIVYLSTQIPGPENNEPKLGPIQKAISEWLKALPELRTWKSGTTRAGLLKSSPQRWSIYEPMLLLPSGSFQDAAWKALLGYVDKTCLSSLWKEILDAIWKKEGGKELTHLAINSGIPSKQDSPIMAKQESHYSGIPPKQDTRSASGENILRSPSGLILLHGDFGPMVETQYPTEADFHRAFWVSTKQNGVFQTWAPRYTMFSRGNIKEKSRIIRFHDPGTAITAHRRQVGLEERAQATAIDLYAGIGYFAFSYAAAGFGRVVCWEINPWSVEGLRRGCLRNGWSCKIVRGSELKCSVKEVLGSGTKVVVLEEGNESAAGRIKALKEWQDQNGEKVLGDILHVNCGFLPSSEASWERAWRIICKSRSAWFHLHENIGVNDVETRRKDIEEKFRKWALEGGTSLIVDIEHVELVKTFAPGVWHCVLDVHVQPALMAGSKSFII